MNEPITKGLLLKHYYLLGFTAAETLKKTQAFETEGFTYSSVVYKTFKKFKDGGLVAGDPSKLPDEAKAALKRKAEAEGSISKKPRKPYTRKNKIGSIDKQAASPVEIKPVIVPPPVKAEPKEPMMMDYRHMPVLESSQVIPSLTVQVQTPIQAEVPVSKEESSSSEESSSEESSSEEESSSDEDEEVSPPIVAQSSLTVPKALPVNSIVMTTINPVVTSQAVPVAVNKEESSSSEESSSEESSSEESSREED